MHKPMPRLFLASPVAPTAAMRDVMADLQTFDRALRVVRTAPLHVTYRFLGNIEEARVPALIEAMEHVLPDRPDHTLRWHGISALPNTDTTTQVNVRRARVLITTPTPAPGEPALQPIADAIDRALDALEGIPPRDKPFFAHVTLARFRRQSRGRVPRSALDALAAWLDQHTATALGESHITQVQLLESVLTPTGPRYTVRGVWPRTSD
jgi:2'-5' RNA ligase